MALVKVVTDSSADLPPKVADELGITVIPLYIRFGDEVYRDGIDINADQFFKKIAGTHVLPKTSTPSPGDFADIYTRLASETDSIVSIHLSPRYSSAFNTATIAKDYTPEGCRVEIVDSKSVSMGCGLVVMAAARKARAGADLEEVLQVVSRTIRHTRIIGMITDIRFVLSGRRLNLPGAHLILGKLGTILRFKLIGEIYEAGHVRGRGMYFSEKKALNKLEQCISEFQSFSEIAVLYAQKPEWARKIADRVTLLFPTVKLYITPLSSVTGMHGGPKAMAIAIMESNVVDKDL